ncbi:MAG: DeoR/GlpR family DNA-binding transcription regulator [Synergistota bacterium]|nr:DeoR/GlpR family DNA-binding transcription regulator [Synergistota bacterium]
MGAKEDRRKAILEVLHRKGSAKPADLAEDLSVSLVTIRRDIKDLISLGKISSGYGFVRLQSSPSGAEQSFARRLHVNVDVKRSLAIKAMEYINDNDVVFLGAGTTCYFLAELMVSRFTRLHIVTNGLKALEILAGAPGFNVECVGGSLLPGFNSMVGPKAESSLRSSFFSKAFLSCASYRCDSGVFDLSPFTAGVKQVVVSNTKQLYLMVDSSKIGAAAPSLIAPAESFGHVITDDPEMKVPQRVSVSSAG